MGNITAREVIKLVIYFGAEEWDGPLSLQEMHTNCGGEILKYVADYRINLITRRGLSDDEIDEFQTNMREIMKYIKYSNDKKKLNEIIGTEQRFRNVERSAVGIINAATNSNMKIDEGKETIDMCLAVQEMREESRLEGRSEGRNEGEIIGAITFAKELGVSGEDVKKSFMVKYKKTDEETEELMKLYWK
ncbi:MAG: Rpn family recombination-promoting nuclease/putative transposase [Lachnospiraceae bacterium]|nr:Rpn family recombination-promoting nuclease/putative transposase [Lachnospiraceae bacterium]